MVMSAVCGSWLVASSRGAECDIQRNYDIMTPATRRIAGAFTGTHVALIRITHGKVGTRMGSAVRQQVATEVGDRKSDPATLTAVDQPLLEQGVASHRQ